MQKVRLAGALPSAAERTSTIRRTDWPDVTLANVRFINLGGLRFRNGKASSGAGSPTTEDALILIECGSDGMQQALIPVKLGSDQRTRKASGFIKADPPTGPGKWMTFTSYALERQVIVTTVRKTDGNRETRRYRFVGGLTWQRS